MVRTLLNGRFANTSFCVFDPQGNRKLSKSGRGPQDLARGRGRGKTDDAAIIREMNRIAAQFKPAINDGQAVLQDFNSFRQALNVASADQRPLIFVTSDNRNLKDNIRVALENEELIGKFHLDFGDIKTDKKWAENINGVDDKSRVFVIRSGKFGISGAVMKSLPEKASSEEIVETLKQCNENFASVESRKKYSQHVSEGRRKGIYFENEIPYGEDRDGDGKADRQNRSRRGRR